MGIALKTKQDWQLHVPYSQYSGGSTCQGKPNKFLIISTLLRRWRQAISQVKSSTLQLMIYRNHFILYLPVKILKLFFLFAGRTLASPTTHSKQGYSRLPRWFLNPPKDGDLTASLRLWSLSSFRRSSPYAGEITCFATCLHWLLPFSVHLQEKSSSIFSAAPIR